MFVSCGNFVVGHIALTCCTRFQHLGGNHLVTRLLETAVEGLDVHDKCLVAVDCYGYDGCPAQVCLTHPGFQKVACVTICQEEDSRSYITANLCNTIHRLARAGTLKLPAFPDIDRHVKQLMAPTSDPRTSISLKVCVFLPVENALAIQDRVVEKWLCSRRAKDFQLILDQHNTEFNPKKLDGSTYASNKRPADESSEAAASVNKKAKISLVPDTIDTWDKLMVSLTDNSDTCSHPTVCCSNASEWRSIVDSVMMALQVLL